ncbi:response regulator transcription factor [Embleya sp. NPDC020886]|uniref:response regulator transcription factor n=1 Tax=Embleya sp. NPDC020886 TaxID=3363980 RepID=UPI0037B8B406
MAEQCDGRGGDIATPVRRTLDGITDREREVLALVARGLSDSELAAHPTIGIATAKTHVARLFTKLDARDRVHLVILAYEAGLGPASRPVSDARG